MAFEMAAPVISPRDAEGMTGRHCLKSPIQSLVIEIMRMRTSKYHSNPSKPSIILTDIS
jgi:hypothetical protein